jgi:hypothetical protein
MPANLERGKRQLDADGAFIAPQNGSRGAWIPCADAIAVEFLNAVADPADNP